MTDRATVYETLMKRGLLGTRKLYTEEAIRAAARHYKLWLPSVLVDIDCDKCGRPFAQKGAWTRHVRSCKGIQMFAAAVAERQARVAGRQARQNQRDALFQAQRKKIEREQKRRRKRLRAQLKELDHQHERARKKELERRAREQQEDLERLQHEQLKRLQREQREQAQREQREQREQERRARETERAQQRIFAEEERAVGPRRHLWARNDTETRKLLFMRCNNPNGHLCVDLEQPKFLDAIEDLGEPYSEWTSSVFDEALTVPRSGPMNRTLRTQLDELNEQLVQLHRAEGVLQLRVNRARALPVNDDDWRSELIHLMVGGL